jgi:hypothetical protein
VNKMVDEQNKSSGMFSEKENPFLSLLLDRQNTVQLLMISLTVSSLEITVLSCVGLNILSFQ